MKSDLIYIKKFFGKRLVISPDNNILNRLRLTYGTYYNNQPTIFYSTGVEDMINISHHDSKKVLKIFS